MMLPWIQSHGCKAENTQRSLVASCGEIIIVKPYVTLMCQTFIAGSPHKDLVGGDDDRHSHLQTRGVFLLSTAHLDQPHEVQVINLTLIFSSPCGCTVYFSVACTDTLMCARQR